jgi:hypothetical protein
MVANLPQLHEHVKQPHFLSTIAVNHIKVVGDQIFVPCFLKLTHANE